MSHDYQSLTHTSRPLSPRLHRRSMDVMRALTPVSPALSCSIRAATTQTVAGLPEAVLREAGMLELVAAEMRIAELERELAEARATASTDPLTGAVNRRGLDSAFRRELARVGRSGSALSVVVFDVDDFKRVNDTHGHALGDQALTHLVTVLRAALRPVDVIGRLGGEEFALLLVDADRDEAMATMARLQRELAAQPLAAAGLSLTVSAGVASHDGEESLDALLARADTASYIAKRSGKNRVVCA
jgi:diguanylate cyclase